MLEPLGLGELGPGILGTVVICNAVGHESESWYLTGTGYIFGDDDAIDRHRQCLTQSGVVERRFGHVEAIEIGADVRLSVELARKVFLYPIVLRRWKLERHVEFAGPVAPELGVDVLRRMIVDSIDLRVLPIPVVLVARDLDM